MTGAPSIETAREAVELGAVQYLTKPIDRGALIKAVASAQHAYRRPKEVTADPAQAAGFDGALGRALDPLLRLYFSERFEQMMDEHFRTEFMALPALLDA
jgi:YesN/AraC family two-component response regulator